MNIKLCPKAFFLKNLYIMCFLLFANILGIVATYYFDLVSGLIILFDFNSERNIPTLYSSVALVFSSILLAAIAFESKKLNWPYISWLGLSLIFLFLSVDEMASIHESLVFPVRKFFGASGFLYYSWVIPYGVVLVFFIIAYSKFLFQLPKRTMILFLISGSIFVLGAIGFELLGGKQAHLYGTNNILYSIFYTCEEFLEMFGIAIFIYTLLTYMVNQFDGVVISITRSKDG
ncbi:MAG: hypothetical protein ACJAUP_003699 [Cellvibrionaceae bacterium]|jgi:hypothetical protein